MKKTIIILLTLLVIGLGVCQTVQAEKLTAEALQLLADRYQYFIAIPPMGEEPLRYLYADIGPHVHVYEVVDGKAEAAWETGNLGAPVTALLFTDLDGSGNPNIIVSTLNGRLIAYDGMNYERVWENFQEPFKSIACMTTHNIDVDPQDEVIIIGESALSDGSFIFIYDSVNSDPQPELILNSGFVIDSRFYNIDLIKRERGGFGNHLSLQDLNDDGYPEIIGRVPNRSLQIYDLYAERDIW
jgi:hypothetical protein